MSKQRASKLRKIIARHECDFELDFQRREGVDDDWDGQFMSTDEAVEKAEQGQRKFSLCRYIRNPDHDPSDMYSSSIEELYDTIEVKL